MSAINVLFITHVSSRTGAPLLLLNFIKWLNEKKMVKPSILIGISDELDSEFAELGTCYFLFKKKSSLNKSILFKIYCRLYNSSLGEIIYNYKLQRRLKKSKIDVVYSNTIGNGYLMKFCKSLKVKIITHSHENEKGISYFGSNNIKLVKLYSDFFIACSELAHNALVQNGVAPSKIDIIYSSVNSNFSLNGNIRDVNILNAKSKNYPIIASCGGLTFNKGIDLIVPLIKELVLDFPNLLFIWVGGNKESNEYKKLENEVSSNQLINNFVLTGSVENPMDYFSLINVFVLLSREESLSLVCLESSLLSKPVVCFKNFVGGEVRFGTQYNENLISYLDISAMASRIKTLLNDKELSNTIGEYLKKRVKENFTYDICFPMAFEVIKKNVNIEFFTTVKKSCFLSFFFKLLKF